MQVLLRSYPHLLLAVLSLHVPLAVSCVFPFLPLSPYLARRWNDCAQWQRQSEHTCLNRPSFDEAFERFMRHVAGFASAPHVVYQLYVRGPCALSPPTSLFADAGWLLPQNLRIAAVFAVLSF
jgi:hypothetical protein